METSALNPNTLAFIALCNEYCTAAENARDSERDSFVAQMLKLLPRLYICATDLNPGDEAEAYIDDSLDEAHYDSVRSAVGAIMGEDDVYLEVFEEDMKYSDTPIAASISEGLADIFQPLYNFVEAVKNSPTEEIPALAGAAKEDFETYWSRILCNVMRALNNVRYNTQP